MDLKLKLSDNCIYAYMVVFVHYDIFMEEEY